MFSKVLIANRGVIVTRILRTLRKLGVKSVVIYSSADQDAPYIHEADESYPLGEGAASTTYLNVEKILQIAAKANVDAIHPGYGFLSENAEFIEKCDKQGITWLGPTADQVRSFGYKHKARELAAKAEVPLVPGTGLLSTVEEACEHANKLQYPVILKSTAGGGGIGMHICRSESELKSSFDSVKTLSKRNFGDDSVYLEVYIQKARHIEVQLFGDGKGEVVALGERDCSTQRRNQKVIEECPAPAISEEVRKELHKTAVQLGSLVKYRSAGTVEFIYDSDRAAFYFLEVNTRLQVEHGVTEMVYQVDLVEWMIKLGSGDLPSLKTLASHLSPRGHAIQARVYAEDPLHNFRPSAGLLTSVVIPESSASTGIRVDTWVKSGTEVTALFDPMIAKVIRWSESRDGAISGLADLLENSIDFYGIITNKDWLVAILVNDKFRNADLSTQWLNSFEWVPNAFEIVAPGTMTMVQDFPGRQGYWDVGVPPSGPFDDWSFRLGNELLLHNNERDAGLEITVSGPTIKFYHPVDVAVTGAPLSQILLNKQSVPQWQVVKIKSGDVLEIGRVNQGGMRAYLLVKGGIQCPEYLGSRSTFTLGQFGGHSGRALKTGDRLMLSKKTVSETSNSKGLNPAIYVPELGTKDKTWNIAVSYGPHGGPDFFTPEDIDTFFSHEWEVHYNSSRTGVRLIGPHPKWARKDGGEAGLHPSNIHDNAYAFGAIDFTGDMPIILGPDGPSLGGFVCPATVIRCERWKISQLAPGDKLKFIPVSLATAKKLEDQYLGALSKTSTGSIPQVSAADADRGSPIVRSIDSGVQIVYRRAGDDFLLIEFGPMELDIAIRFRAHAWMLWVKEKNLKGIAELTPGIRSLQIHYDPQVLSLSELLKHLEEAEVALKDVESLEIDTREVHLPLSWDDEACRYASEYYQRSVRPNAPWCPNNLEFIRRINGLKSIDEVFDIVFKASYLVLGLGDVYLGAPVATPLDPSQRLVTTKYNPARTWTAENSVGIGGAYLCVYGMEGPGGYQFVGRTLQMWNRYGQTELFNKPWLLRFFDQIKFHKVSHDELMKIRRDFPQGRYELEVRPRKFRLDDYLESLKPEAGKIAAFRKKREQAFRDEIDMWHKKGLFTFEDTVQAPVEEMSTLEEGESSIDSPIAGSIWKLNVKEGDHVEKDQVVAVIESMKMEFTINASEEGVIAKVAAKEGATISSGQTLFVVKQSS